MGFVVGVLAFAFMAAWFYSIEHFASIWKLLKLETIVLLPVSTVSIFVLAGVDTFSSALTLTLASSGNTYSSVAFAVARLLKKQVWSEGGMRPLLTIKTLKNVLNALLWGGCFWGALFAINFYKSYQVFHHPPQFHFELKSEEGIELLPGTTFPEDMGNRRQYAFEITRTDASNVPGSVQLEVRFPFVVEQPSITYTDAEQASFGPLVSPVPVIVRGRAQSLGQPEYRYWTVNVNNMAHSGKVRFTFLLNPDYRRRIIAITVGKKTKNPTALQPASTLGAPYKWGGPKYDYLLMRADFSYGGRRQFAYGYAPLIADSMLGTTVRLGVFQVPPPDLNRFIEIP